METFSALLALLEGNSPVNSPHKGQWHGALIFSLICAGITGWVNNRKAGDLRRHRAHHHVTVLGKMFPAIYINGSSASNRLELSEERERYVIDGMPCELSRMWDLEYEQAFYNVHDEGPCWAQIWFGSQHKLMLKMIFSCKKAALWMVFLSVCLSHLFLLCSHHCIIMKFSGIITNDQRDVHAKGQC